MLNERVTGTLGGTSGSFVFQDQGTLSDDVVSGSWFVVPGSGPGELAGLLSHGKRQPLLRRRDGIASLRAVRRRR